ncbi:hypothetical protein [Leisingera methylohalidivorans]|uniref:Uncharacterized protein n=1 Tax=Leisingera methylohalidivorans DSM 14336 TaxID=999552 RepID=V9VZT3_9RHOB|nr:hypothetical protein [Leisingera methylohalidivorans]AHD02885.1 hypothetical protein METH_04195 [Leisingera methylohalidivorans DSM 14336]
MNALLAGNGVISRNMIDAMAFCPPLAVSLAEIDEMTGFVAKSLDQLAANV